MRAIRRRAPVFLLIDLNGECGQCAGVGGAGEREGLQVGRSSRLTGTIAWMRLGRPTPAGVGVSSAVTRR